MHWTGDDEVVWEWYTSFDGRDDRVVWSGADDVIWAWYSYRFIMGVGWLILDSTNLDKFHIYHFDSLIKNISLKLIAKFVFGWGLNGESEKIKKCF